MRNYAKEDAEFWSLGQRLVEVECPDKSHSFVFPHASTDEVAVAASDSLSKSEAEILLPAKNVEGLLLLY